MSPRIISSVFPLTFFNSNQILRVAHFVFPDRLLKFKAKIFIADVRKKKFYAYESTFVQDKN